MASERDPENASVGKRLFEGVWLLFLWFPISLPASVTGDLRAFPPLGCEVHTMVLPPS